MVAYFFGMVIALHSCNLIQLEMKHFIYKIKGKGENREWLFPPLWTDEVFAENIKQAKELVCEIYDTKFPSRVLRSDIDNHQLLLVVKEIKDDDHYTKALFAVNSCKHCGRQYKQIEKYQIGNTGGGFDFCSSTCAEKYKRDNQLLHTHIEDYRYGNVPMIYKITNKQTGLCYIGKTVQIFTLRWYQHFFQSSESKFHQAIKNTTPADWIFEVLEIIEVPVDMKLKYEEVKSLVFSREMHYVNLYDSIRNGYNSVASITEEIDQKENENQLELFD